VYALLADGSTVEIRPAGPGDFEAGRCGTCCCAYRVWPDDLPEVTELDLNPVIARADGVFVADARIRAAPYRPQDPFLRKLR